MQHLTRYILRSKLRIEVAEALEQTVHERGVRGGVVRVERDRLHRGRAERVQLRDRTRE